ncbi:MAG: hypothetical protein FD138_4312 [Planctomycetota bacterium]|nr:MAG: hypothetical protein FD138_4312 [Planctomycetota bacterium]
MNGIGDVGDTQVEQSGDGDDGHTIFDGDGRELFAASFGRDAGLLGELLAVKFGLDLHPRAGLQAAKRPAKGVSFFLESASRDVRSQRGVVMQRHLQVVDRLVGRVGDLDGEFSAASDRAASGADQTDHQLWINELDLCGLVDRVDLIRGNVEAAFVLAKPIARQRQPHLARLAGSQLAEIFLDVLFFATGEHERVFELDVDQHVGHRV